jgi:hypothetical protein
LLYGGSVEQDEIKSLVRRLARPQSSGGYVVERAAVLAEGADSDAVLAWITAHGGTAEATAETSARHGLHGSQLHPGGGSRSRSPSRFVLPPGALD